MMRYITKFYYKKHTLYFFSILIFYFTLNLNLHASISDSNKVSLDVKNLPLRNILEILSKQSQVLMVYSDNLVEGIFVTCSFSNTTLDEALKEILKNSSVTYKWTGANRIVLFPLNRERSFSISGYVFDEESGETLPFANVTIIGTVYGTTSNRHGRFVFLDLLAQNYSLKIQYIGYLSKTFEVNPDTLTREMLIPLQRTSFISDTIVVSDTGSEIIGLSKQPSKLTISPVHFSSLPIFVEKDILRSLQLMPGILNGSYGGADIFIRGGLPSENLIRFDGMTLYHLDHSFGFLSAVNADAVKDVQVFKGGYPAKYGGRISGLIDMTAKTGNLNKPGVTVGLNQLSIDFLGETPLFGKGALLVSGRRSYSNNFLKNLYNLIFQSSENNNNPSSQNEQIRDIFFYDLFAKLSYTPTDKDVVTLSGYWSRDNLETNLEINDSLEDSTAVKRFIHLDQDSKSNRGNRGYSIRWFRQWNPGFYSTATAAYSDYFSDYNFIQSNTSTSITSRSDNPDSITYRFEVDNNNNLEDWNFGLENSLQLDSQHQIEFGTDISRIDIKNISDVKDTSISLSSSSHSWLISFFLQDNWQINDKMEVVVGLRLTNNSVTHSQYIEPRLSASYKLNDQLLLKGAWGKFNQFIIQTTNWSQQPSGYVTWVLAGDRNIRPSFAEHFILGAQFTKGNYLIDIELYHKKLDGIFSYLSRRGDINDTISTDKINQNFGRVRGIDILFQKMLGPITGFISYGFSKAEVNNESTMQITYYPMNYDTRHDLKLAAIFNYKMWTFSATWSFTSGKPYSIPTVLKSVGEGQFVYPLPGPPKDRNNLRLPSTHRLDMGLMYRFANNLFDGKVGISIFNLYDKEIIWERYFIIQNEKPVPVDIKAFGFKPTLNIELNF